VSDIKPEPGLPPVVAEEMNSLESIRKG